MNSIKNSLFEAGMQVRLIGAMREKYGAGVFIVVVAHQPITRCTCGVDFYETDIYFRGSDMHGDPVYGHAPSCGIYNVERYGHPQEVTVQLPDGKRNVFSGAWLIPAEC